MNGDGVVDGGDIPMGTGTYSGDNGTVTFNGAPTLRTLPAGTVEQWLLSYTLNGGGSPSQTIVASIASAGDVAAVGVSSATSLPVLGTPLNST